MSLVKLIPPGKLHTFLSCHSFTVLAFHLRSPGDKLEAGQNQPMITICCYSYPTAHKIYYDYGSLWLLEAPTNSGALV